MGCRTPGFPVPHCLPEFAQTHVDRVGDAIQPSHPLSPPSPFAFNLSQRQSLDINKYLPTAPSCRTEGIGWGLVRGQRAWKRVSERHGGGRAERQPCGQWCLKFLNAFPVSELRSLGVWRCYSASIRNELLSVWRQCRGAFSLTVRFSAP